MRNGRVCRRPRDDVAPGLPHVGEVQLCWNVPRRVSTSSTGTAQHDLAERPGVVHADELERDAGRSLASAVFVVPVVAGVAEGDPPGAVVPAGVMVGLDALQLESADLEGDAVARLGEHLVHPVADLEA
jgi:hypothetical protein